MKEIQQNKKRQIRMKQESSYSSSRDYDFSDESDYKIKIHNKKKSYMKNDPIKLCAKLTANLLMIAYKSKIIKLKLDEDPIHRQIYFLTFIESLEKIFYQNK